MKTDLAADGTNDRLGRKALEQRPKSGETGANDTEGGLNGSPEHDPVVVD